jgi:two-component system, LytTR family, sensor kinase
VECESINQVKILIVKSSSVLNLWSFWQIQLIGWGCFYLFDLLESIHYFLTNRVSIDNELVPVSFMFLGSFALRPICRRLLRQSPSWIAFESRAAAASMATAIPAGCASCFILRFFHPVVQWHAVVATVMWSFFILFMWCSLYFSIKQWQQSSGEKERLLRAESEIREARLLALRYQLNPHFLFNSLNAVSTLILDGNAPAATRMLAQIGDLLRTSLDSEVTAEVTLSQELAFTEGYLAIEQTRLGERLKIDMGVPWETRDVLVPNMLLQPLVENAVRYGVAPLVEGGWITIKSALHADKLQIAIGNSGRRGEGEQKPYGNGIGLRNTAERLRTLYGADFAFSLSWPEAGGCEVLLELPLRRACNLEETSTCVP